MQIKAGVGNHGPGYRSKDILPVILDIVLLLVAVLNTDYCSGTGCAVDTFGGTDRKLLGMLNSSK